MSQRPILPVTAIYICFIQHAKNDYFRNALEVSKEVSDVAFEAQSCYSLGNTYTLMENYQKAVDYHTRHLHYAMQLGDQ